MYSEQTVQWIRREKRRTLLRRVRKGAIFVAGVAVGMWGYLTWQADNRTFAWDTTVDVAVVALVDAAGQGASSDAGRFVQRFLSRAAPPRESLLAVEEWFHDEYARHTGERRDILRFEVRGPVRLAEPPPALPDSDAPFLDRLRMTDAFLDFFSELAARDDLLLGTYDVTLFVCFFDMYAPGRSDLFGRRDSIASRRNGIGVVFAPLSYDVLGHTCAIVAHELCHMLGATDKYEGGRSVYPEGFAEPERDPLYPQDHAEIMAMGRPVAREKEEIVTDLDDCAIGRHTADEINWTARD